MRVFKIRGFDPTKRAAGKTSSVETAANVETPDERAREAMRLRIAMRDSFTARYGARRGASMLEAFIARRLASRD